MRQGVVVTGGVVLGTLVAFAISAGWRKRTVPIGTASSKVICGRPVRTSALLPPENAPDDPLDRYRRTAAI